MRRLFTTAEAAARGLSSDALRWGDTKGHWRRIETGVYGEGREQPTPLDRARAAVIASRGVAEMTLAGVLYGLDSVPFRGPAIAVSKVGNGRRPGVRRRNLDPNDISVIEGVSCTTPRRTLIDLARVLTDLEWEQALESALRNKLVSVGDFDASREARIRRVLALRPLGAAPTESLLETLMVQLARTIPGLPPPTRQLVLWTDDGVFVARIDLSWPELGLFLELDGQQHLGQPVYDAQRQTAVVAATGWLCGRFTWTQVKRYPRTTARQLADLVDQATRRPLIH